MLLRDKSVLITGGSSGIGLATARLMITEGARVAITGRDQAKLDAAVTELGSVLTIQGNLDDQAAIDATVETVRGAFGSLDVLFANAGISGPTPLGSTTLTMFEAILRTNLTSVFLTVQAALPLMSAGGAIILNGSVMRQLGYPGASAYAATKGGVTAMAKVFASARRTCPDRRH
jgi:NAD(P)-dependent dehydrogenase (short-subunit alcohol dehydrogenase family)